MDRVYSVTDWEHYCKPGCPDPMPTWDDLLDEEGGFYCYVATMNDLIQDMLQNHYNLLAEAREVHLVDGCLILWDAKGELNLFVDRTNLTPEIIQQTLDAYGKLKGRPRLQLVCDWPPKAPEWHKSLRGSWEKADNEDEEDPGRTRRAG